MSLPPTAILSPTGDLWNRIVYLALLEKNVEFNLVTQRNNVHPPALQEREFVISEPMVIIEFINERFPDPALLPEDLSRKARTRQLMHTINVEIIQLAINIEKSIRENKSKRQTEIESLQKELESRFKDISPVFKNQEFILGDELSLLDIMLGTVIWKADDLGIKLAKTGPLSKYKKTLAERESFQTVADWVERY